MYTDTVQTFVILAGAFILTGYGMGFTYCGQGMALGCRRAFNVRARTLLVSATWVLRRAFALGPDPLTTLPAQLSMKWAGTRVSSTNTWEQ